VTPSPTPSSGGGTGLSTPKPRPTVPVTVPLLQGMQGPQVSALQAILIYESLLSMSTPSGIFDPATVYAVQAFQKRENIVTFGAPLTTGYGAVGPATRAKLNLRVSTSTVTTPMTGKGITITRVLFKGTRGTDVSLLQAYLIAKSLLPKDSVTGYFGPLTEAAVKKLQASWQLEPVGSVGPKTRQYLREGR
jgi:peptidoglycan hydrolase-like protein with peptidoglycan-binding domain